MVVPNLVRQALAGEPLTVFGDGRQTRCFSFVRRRGSRAGAHRRDAREPGPGLQPRWFLRGVDHGSGPALVDVTGSSSTIELVPYEQAYGEGYEDMRRRVPDNTKARELVGYDPRTTLDEIIAAVAADQRAAAAAPVLVG